MRRLILALSAFLLAPAFAQFTTIAQPTASYKNSTSVITISGADGTTLSSLSGSGQTLTFSPSLDIHTVPSGGWSTWSSPPNSESSTPRVVGTYNPITAFTVTLSTPSSTFGFELEPDSFSVFNITATFKNGSSVLGTIAQSVNGSAGARLFAATSSTPITSVDIAAPSGANGFALAQFRSATTGIPTTPLPSSGLLMLAGVAFLGFVAALRSRAV